MKIFLAAVVMVALLTGGASAQISGATGDNANTFSEKVDAARRRAEEKRREQMELDAKYKAALDKTKAPEAAPDPWATVRPAPAPKR